MQNIQSDTQGADAGSGGSESSGSYRERLTPSLWAFVAAVVVAPMAALVLAPFDGALALAAGAVIAVAVVALMILLSPVIEVRDGWLRAGRAHVETRLLGAARAYSGEDARTQRGTALDPRSWMLIRGGIDGLLVIPLEDPDDPVPSWVVSTRTPDRLAAALRGAEVTRRTPRR